MLCLGIVDHDVHYAESLVNFFGIRYREQVNSHLFSTLADLRECMEQNRLNMVLASAELLPNPEVLADVITIAYLSDEANITQIKNHPAVFRYQRGENLLWQLKSIAAASDHDEIVYSPNGHGEIWAFLGAGGGSGCTTVAAGCAAQLARGGKKVIYLCLQNNGYIGHIFDNESGSSMSSVLYEVKTMMGIPDGGGQLLLKLEGLLKYDSLLQIYYYNIFDFPNEAASMSGGEAKYLLETLTSGFDVVVADLDGIYAPLLESILPAAQRIVLTASESEADRHRAKHMLGALALLDKGTGSRTLRCTHLLYNHVDGSSKQDNIENVSVLGAIEQFNGMNARRIVQELQRRDTFLPWLRS